MSRTPDDVVSTETVADPVGAYSTALWAGGFLYVSGMLATDAAGHRVGTTIGEQTAQTLRNIALVLEAAGSGLHDVVTVTSYLTDDADFAEYDWVDRQHVDEPFPARMTCVVGLRPEFFVELDVIAHPPGAGATRAVGSG